MTRRWPTEEKKTSKAMISEAKRRVLVEETVRL